ncbi:type I CRISPR-associated protein Cas7 [Emticicia fluvialis]|uniref:type I CRISPR-associated protein Cas7 n=1 Tax=Emticicia fluvialis TaxID=2974474 RepID=UPI002166BF7F|nr:type I CRISPR-associated protein Cas7 [Emticicia fluvialis]
MGNSFKNRVFGCAIIKSINSNYNADFSHQPRTLPNGIVYATDKVLKYSIRNYWKKVQNEPVFYSKSLTEDMSPRTLDETLELHFGKIEDKGNALRLKVLKNLLSCIDVRVFGGTYAGKTNLSIHGACQITHGVNRFAENVIYSEQIMSPFRNPSEKNNESTMTTLGTQSKLQEGHYVHHFSVNPKNIEEDVNRAGIDGLSESDINKLKEALRNGVTYYDSAAKAGTENELLLWVQLKSDSKIVLPSFVELVEVKDDRTIDLSLISELLAKDYIHSEIEKIELYYNKGITKLANVPIGAIEMDL